MSQIYSSRNSILHLHLRPGFPPPTTRPARHLTHGAAHGDAVYAGVVVVAAPAAAVSWITATSRVTLQSPRPDVAEDTAAGKHREAKIRHQYQENECDLKITYSAVFGTLFA